jgi:hypothetical protein
MLVRDLLFGQCWPKRGVGLGSILATLCLPFLIHAQDSLKITEKNWINHPKIAEIRKIVKEIEDGIKSGSIKVNKQENGCNKPYEDAKRTLAKDKKGRVVRYTREGGSDDSYMKWSFYYDVDSHLLFVFISAGAVNGAQFEGRIYLSKEKTRLWEKYGYKTDQNYTFDYPAEDKDLICNPDSAFISPVNCE